MSLCVSECVIVEKEFEVGKNWLRKKFGWSTYAFKVVIATILLLLYNTVRVYRPPHHDHRPDGPPTVINTCSLPCEGSGVPNWASDRTGFDLD